MEPGAPVQASIYAAAVRLFAESGREVGLEELARAAGVSRAVLSANLVSPDRLFESVAAQLASEMQRRIALSFAGIDDPAQRLANGMRYFLQRAHQEQHWGRFVTRFAFSSVALQGMWSSAPARELLQGIASGRFSFRPEQLPAVLVLTAGTVLSGMYMVLQGVVPWLQAGSDCAELVLRAIGIPPQEAAAMAGIELAPLPGGSG